MKTKSRLPSDWKVRLGLTMKTKRFRVQRGTQTDSFGKRLWCVRDLAYEKLRDGYTSKATADFYRRFAETYAEHHGDIDFDAFPITMLDALRYRDIKVIERWWADHPPRGVS